MFIGRNTILSCKNGDIVIDDEANIGFNTEIFSASRVHVGKKVLIAAYTYLVGGDHLYDRVDIPVLDQARNARGIDVADHVWLGAHVVVTDGSTSAATRSSARARSWSERFPDFTIAVVPPAQRSIRDAHGPSESEARSEVIYVWHRWRRRS